MRILIVDDHTIFREGLVGLLQGQPDLEVAGEASDGEEAVRQAAVLRPDIVLLDLSMPRRAGLDVLSELAATPSCRVLVLTASITRREIVEALQLGARGVVLKDAGTALLFKGIRAVAAGQYWVDRESVSDLIQLLRQSVPAQPPAAKFGLTKRELQIVSAIAAGYTNRDVAQQLSVSQDTVKHHLSNIFDKVGVSNRLELALFTLNHKLVDPDRPAQGASS